MEVLPAKPKLAEDELQRLLARIQALRTIDRAILAAESLEEIAHTALAHLRRLLHAERAAVALWGPGEEATLLAVASEGPTAVGPGTRLPLGPEWSTPALRRGEAVVYQDLQEQPDPSPTDRRLRAEGIRAYLRVPLVAKGDLIGTLSLGAAAPRAFTAEHVEIARELADQLALALENARVHQAELRWRTELQAVMSLTRDIVGEQSLSALLQDVLSRAITLIGAHGGTLYLWDGPAQLFVPRAWVNHGAYMQGFRHRLGEHLTGKVAAAGQGEIWNEYPQHPGHDAELLRQTPLTACMAAPLKVQDRLQGALVVDHIQPGYAFTAEGLRLLETFANQTAIAIENAQLYEEKRLAAKQLEATVEDRTRELQAANQALAAANADLAAASRHKSEFLAAMSHELRTPLNSILGFAQILLERPADLPVEKQTRYLSHIYNSGQHLLRLISDVVDLAKVEAGKFVLQPEPLPVAATLEDILVIARGLATRKGQAIHAEIEAGLPPLWADPVRFKQILFNLLSNAVKFTPDAGTITLTARRVSGDAETRRRGDGPTRGTGEPEQGGVEEAGAPRPRVPASPRLGEAGCLEVRVTDTGVGIRPEDLPKLFQEFVQLDTTRAQHHEGSGLGLALTKRLVELHGGRISAESAGEGQGSTFAVWLPFGGPDGSGQ